MGTRDTDVIIIGGGLSGLTAAAYLGRGGLSVKLLEKAHRLGGRASTDDHGGALLNRGPHALYRSGQAGRILGDLGIPFSAGSAPLSGWGLSGGALHRLPVGSASLLSTGLLGWAGKASAASLFARIPQMDGRGLERLSVSDWLTSLEARPDVALVLHALIRVSTYANAPESFSARTALAQLKKARGGVLYVDGGWQTLGEGLATRARSWGSELVTSAHASALRVTARGVTVALEDGTELGARAVVLAASRRATLSLLENAGVSLPEDLAPNVKMSALDLVLERVPRPDQRFVLGVDRPLYLSIHSGVARLGQRGFVIHVGKYLDGKSSPSQDRAELEELLDVAQPGWREVLEAARFLPQMTVAERLDTAADGGPEGRPDFRVPGLPHVFVAGDWVKGGTWLCDASLETARKAALAVADLLSKRRAVA